MTSITCPGCRRSSPLAGFIGDRLRRKDLILGSCLFWSTVTVMTGWCSKLWQFVTVRALDGFGETFYFPASMLLTSDYHDRRTRSRALSFHQSSVYLGTIAGGWLGAWFAEKHGWRSGFYFFGGAGVLLALVLFQFLHGPRRWESEAVDAGLPAAPLPWPEFGRALFRTPTAMLLMTVFLLANFVTMIFQTWTPTFLVEKFHFQLTSAGLSGSAFIHLASAFSVPLGRIFADRLVRRLTGGRMLVQALGLLVGSGAVFLVGTTADVNTLLLAMMLFGLCKGFYDSNIFAALYDVIDPRAGDGSGRHEHGRLGRRRAGTECRGPGRDAREACNRGREHERGDRRVRRHLPCQGRPPVRGDDLLCPARCPQRKGPGPEP
jgi:MFS family permease